MNISRIHPEIDEKQELLWIGVLFLVVLAIRLIVLFQSRYAYGADGYYYAAQLKYLFTKGYFFSPDGSLMLYLMAGAARIMGDIVISNKIVVAVVGAAVVFPTWRLCRNTKRSFQGILAAAMMVSGTLFAHFTFDYVKNLAGILLFLVFLVELKKLVTDTPSWKGYSWCVILFLMTFLTHKLMGGLSGLVLVITTLWLFRRQWRWIFLSAAAVGGLAVTAGLLVPGALGFADFSRLQGLFSLPPQIAPLSYLELVPNTLPAILELLLFTIGTAVAVVILYRNGKIRFFHWMLAGLALLFVNPLFRFTGDNLAFRLFLLLFLPGTILLSTLFRRTGRSIAIPFLLVLLLLQAINLEHGRRHGRHNYALYNDLLPLINLPEGHLLIVHHGFDYFYCFRGKGDAFHFMPEEKHRNRPLYRLAQGVSSALLKKHKLESRETRYLPGGYTLIREKTWNRLLTLVGIKERKRLLTWKNPHIRRPGYMLENDRFLKK